MPISDLPFQRFSSGNLRYFLKDAYHVVSRVEVVSQNNYKYTDYRFEAVVLNVEIASFTLEKVKEVNTNPATSFAIVKRVNSTLYDGAGKKIKCLEHAFLSEKQRGY